MQIANIILDADADGNGRTRIILYAPFMYKNYVDT